MSEVIIVNGTTDLRSADELALRIGYSFKDKSLLERALTHSSYANERQINKVEDYERIEFLGDAVLELVSSDYLFKTRTDLSEGELTKLRASMVCEQALAFCARDLEIGSFLRLGKGEDLTGGRTRDSIIADVMEAIIGAIYLDSGFEDAKRFIYTFILNDLDEKALFYDAKTILQETLQKNGSAPRYELIREEGPEHSKVFYVEVYDGDKKLAEGSGHNKKGAQQQAAYAALLSLKNKN